MFAPEIATIACPLQMAATDAAREQTAAPCRRLWRRDSLYERVPGDPRAVANVLMNQFAASGVDPTAWQSFECR